MNRVPFHARHGAMMGLQLPQDSFVRLAERSSQFRLGYCSTNERRRSGSDSFPGLDEHLSILVARPTQARKMRKQPDAAILSWVRIREVDLPTNRMTRECRFGSMVEAIQPHQSVDKSLKDARASLRRTEQVMSDAGLERREIRIRIIHVYPLLALQEADDGIGYGRQQHLP